MSPTIFEQLSFVSVVIMTLGVGVFIAQRQKQHHKEQSEVLAELVDKVTRIQIQTQSAVPTERTIRLNDCSLVL
jgi:hypothetical protein